VQAARAEPSLPVHHTQLTFDISGEPWTLQAGHAGLRASGQWVWHFDNTRAGDYLQAWLAHLVLCAAPAPGVLSQTQVLSRDGRFHYSDCRSAGAYLHELMALYRLGLSRPLHFFPKSAWAFATSDNPLQAAAATWRSSKNKPFAEAADPAYRLAFRGQPEPLDAEFQDLAQAVFGPLLQHLHDPRVRR
jgi:exodeoxyribonuclease V gamma subunit